MKGLQGERLRQSFRYFDKDGDGYIQPEDFKRIILDIAGHKLSDSVLERLPTLTTISPGGRISYAEVVAFYTVVKGMCRRLFRMVHCQPSRQRWT
jgi:solute carrier family 25 aspartate/glutamate transporter 12/13